MKSTAFETALALLARGLWPIPIHSRGTPLGGKIAEGKEPIGKAWGKSRPTLSSLQATFSEHPGAGVGLLLGKDAGILDVEVDDPSTGPASVALLFGGEVPETMGWSSARGDHLVFAWTDRVARYGKTKLGGEDLKDFPGIEIRFGALDSDGKQLQSVCPPTLTTEGRPREWNGFEQIAELPESFFITLDPILFPLADSETHSAPSSFVRRPDNGYWAYAAKAFEDELAKLAATPKGGRNNQLNESAASLGTLVGAGVLDVSEVETALAVVARQIGLSEGEIGPTIRSGLTWGRNHPRDLSRLVHQSGFVPLFDPEVENNCHNCHNCQNTSEGEPTDGHSVNYVNSVNGFFPQESWGLPILDGPTPADPFPLSVLPFPLAELAQVGSECIGCPVDYFAVAGLGVASGALGRSVAIRIKEGWVESTSQYLALVGDPGQAKSPAIVRMAAPLAAISSELLAIHRREMTIHKATEDEGPAPRPQRIRVDDTTVEALAVILQDNPRGLIMVRDELTALFASHNQYKGGRGSDRQFYLSAWSQAPATVDRKSNPDRIPIHLPHPYLSIVGGLTPGMLSDLAEAKGRDDGFLDRILFSTPEPVPVRWEPAGIPNALTADWEVIVRRLWSTPMVQEEDKERPWIVRPSPEALEAYAAWFDAHCIEAEGDDFPSYLKGPWAKFRSYCARIALVLDRLHRACDPDPADDGGQISLASMEGAIQLTSYFKTHTHRARSMLRGAHGDNPDARAVLRWIAHKKLTVFSERDARRNFPARFPMDSPELSATLRWLEGRHCIRPQVTEDRPGPGRKPSPVYEVNPLLIGAQT